MYDPNEYIRSAHKMVSDGNNAMRKRIIKDVDAIKKEYDEINGAWDNFQRIREKQLEEQDNLVIDILTGKKKPGEK